jgi:AbrB family looped-hinge helix DNA binding protein
MMKGVTTLTSKGQVTIPKEIRDELGLRPHDKVRFTLVDGKLQVEKAYMSLEEAFGSLKGHSFQGTVEEAIEPWEKNGATFGH